MSRHYLVERIIKYQVVESFTRDDGVAGEGPIAEFDHLEDANNVASALAGAAATAAIENGAVVSVTITNPGTGYTSAKTLDPADTSTT